MADKMRLYICLLFLGVAVIGGGVWMLFSSAPEMGIAGEVLPYFSKK